MLIREKTFETMVWVTAEDDRFSGKAVKRKQDIMEFCMDESAKVILLVRKGDTVLYGVISIGEELVSTC